MFPSPAFAAAFKPAAVSTSQSRPCSRLRVSAHRAQGIDPYTDRALGVTAYRRRDFPLLSCGDVPTSATHAPAGTTRRAHVPGEPPSISARNDDMYSERKDTTDMILAIGAIVMLGMTCLLLAVVVLGSTATV